MWADPSAVEEAKQYLADAPNVTVQVSVAMDAESIQVLLSQPLACKPCWGVFKSMPCWQQVTH
jgi:hypothetical protein